MMNDQAAQIAKSASSTLSHADEAFKEVASCGSSIGRILAAWESCQSDPAGYCRAITDILGTLDMTMGYANANVELAQEVAMYAKLFDDSKAQEVRDRLVEHITSCSKRAHNFVVNAREQTDHAAWIADQYEAEVKALKDKAYSDAVALLDRLNVGTTPAAVAGQMGVTVERILEGQGGDKQ